MVILGLGALGFFTFAPRYVDQSLNRVAETHSDSVSPEARRLHQNLWIADLHADSLLWNRSILSRSSYGHVDLPRLREGNVALQTFSVVTKVPWGQNYRSNRGNTDKIFWLVLAQRWPSSTWFSLAERTLYQARRLRQAARRSNGQLRVVTHRRDLVFPSDKSDTFPGTAGLLAIEGLQALEGDLENLARFDRAGFRMMGIAHFYDNRVGGSAHGVEKHGLTDFGREVVRRIEERGMLVDLAHASPATIEDVLSVANRPVVVSHTGVRGTCEGPRNLTDEQLQGVAATGGVIGIGFWPGAVCEASPEAIAEAIHYTVDTIGADHVALGSDFDGSVRTPFDASGLVKLTSALLKEGLSDQEIQRIMGGNVRELLRDTLPEEE